MNDPLIYILKVSLGLLIISIPYYFLLRNDPNLVLKRFYLVLGLIISWVFPLIVFRRPDVMLNLTPTVFIDPGAAEIPAIELTGNSSQTNITINWIRVALSIYISGLVFMSLKNIWIITRWNITWKRTRNKNGIAFIKSDQVFTIFSRIFVPESLQNNKDLDNILLHEKAHVQQLHFVDLTIMEITLLLTWFNPFSWLISRMIKENHEHLADRQVLSAGINQARYRAQLLNHTLGVNVFRLGNQFNHSLTLKRFKMMKKPEKSPLGMVKITMLIPAILITMGLTTGMTPLPQKTIKGKVILADSGDPAIGAAVVIANSSTGTVVDRDGTFMLNVEGDPEIVVSFVGYGTIRVKASKVGKKPLKLEVKPFEVDLADIPSDNISYSASNSINIHDPNDKSREPVIVLDGEVVITVDNIDPESIEQIEVIKDPDSEIARKYNAKDGVILITSKKTDGDSKKDNVDVLYADDEVFYVVEEMPMFPGGRTDLKTYIYLNLVYPETLKKKGVSGEVYVQFMVKGTGKLDDVSVARSTHKEFEGPAMDVFKDMPDWNPGKQRGKPVNVRVVVPVRFNADS